MLSKYPIPSFGLLKLITPIYLYITNRSLKLMYLLTMQLSLIYIKRNNLITDNFEDVCSLLTIYRPFFKNVGISETRIHN